MMSVGFMMRTTVCDAAAECPGDPTRLKSNKGSGNGQLFKRFAALRPGIKPPRDQLMREPV